MEGIKLEFTDDALRAVARMAIDRNTGARGLRAVLETAMLDVMYELPSRLDVIGCTITADVISDRAEPLLTFRGDAKKKKEA
jgi:ATP-dependent Clp protease ATP-binding subunit ClpX